MNDEFDFEEQRRLMLQEHLQARGIRDARVLQAMSEVPREAFVLPSQYDEAYADNPLAIGCGQTISQPFIVAYMTQLLEVGRGMKVLEIGTGSGYQTAVLAALGAEVVTVERHEPLTEQAVERLESLGLDERVDFRIGDGTLGCAEESPYDRILVTAAGPDVPGALEEQLAENGRMVIPVGKVQQRLVVVERRNGQLNRRDDLPVMFVRLIGEQGHR